MKKEAFVTKAQIEEIAKTYPTPFHIYDEKGIRENARALKEAFAWIPGVLCGKGHPQSLSDGYSAGVWLRHGLFLHDGVDAQPCHGDSGGGYYVFF